ncbi:MAG: bifunctional 5,10-methylenetetrahydrofolate dehydrogenase/5,10-methenyltetrahydrofolate cyclohydrolase [Candidatus Delongbacteria bacterium]|nr:bifunctional 5,10-methylenetetrahydrofolate dehydrogenase/5,10-methenyltetrahydrofolate cyclohydrolase [Candidatus Delongbacteria bacterium]MBN2835915.1 bifunctional 5,10-methylenetetrahydrofolate dehydrogenase/5,10-methenyltetrahydrofolate cyclohydrolase [Candidatus Delongbacteria bacterium]
MAIHLIGKTVAKTLMEKIISDVEALKNSGIEPQLAVYMTDHDPASSVYAKMIVKNCKKAGVKPLHIVKSQDIGENEFLETLIELNNDDSVHGIIVMMPLPKHISESKVSELIDPNKDIDGINPINAGKTILGLNSFVPSTAQACIDILKGYDIKTSGKNVVVLGRSDIVGKPVASLLMQKGEFADATVTVCHSRSKNLQEITKKADILIAAIGKAEMIDESYCSEDQIIVDVGMNEKIDSEGNTGLCGDVKFSSVEKIVEMITPVPGGVSPLTHTALLNNLLKAIKIKKSIS